MTKKIPNLSLKDGEIADFVYSIEIWEKEQNTNQFGSAKLAPRVLKLVYKELQHRIYMKQKIYKLQHPLKYWWNRIVKRG